MTHEICDECGSPKNDAYRCRNCGGREWVRPPEKTEPSPALRVERRHEPRGSSIVPGYGETRRLIYEFAEELRRMIAAEEGELAGKRAYEDLLIRLKCLPPREHRYWNTGTAA